MYMCFWRDGRIAPSGRDGRNSRNGDVGMVETGKPKVGLEQDVAHSCLERLRLAFALHSPLLQ